MNDEASVKTAPGHPAGRSPVVAIVGRPNVGKSTLFNRLTRGRRALVDSRPGVTRDRNVAAAEWGGHPFLLVDTGGFENADASPLAASVRAQSALAAEEADAVIAVFDGRAGLNPLDHEFVQQLRPLRKPVLYAVNKLDSPMRDDDAAEFFGLGLMGVFAISAAHGRGIEGLMESLVARLPEASAVAETQQGTVVTLALVGRPNVGKSSLLNRIVGAERAIVDATPGTTRDPLDTPFRHDDQEYLLVDTAGIRRRPRVHDQLERASVVRALRAIERAEIAILLVDAIEGMTDQDARIAGYAWERRRALLLAVNKWDAVPRAERDRRGFVRTLYERYPTLAGVPAVCLSARTGAHVSDLFPALRALVAAHRREIRTVRLNEALAVAVRTHAPPSVNGRRVHLRYATQTGRRPPTITVFSNAPRSVHPGYARYLTNSFRDAFGLHGVPLCVEFRASPMRPPRPPSRHRGR